MPDDGKMMCHAQCPFLKYADINSHGKREIAINCESPVPDTKIKLCFKTKEAYRKHRDIFCCDHYICCEIYRMLMDTVYGED